jgi:diguanylate cyclase (GGDEF)-like protein
MGSLRHPYLGRFDGGSLPNRLMVILAIPLLAVGIATASQAASQVHLSSNARHLQALVADVADVDLARRRVEAEVMPSLAAVVSATGPVSSHAGASPLAIGQARQLASSLPALRAATDRSFAAALSSLPSPSITAQLAQVRAHLLTVRSSDVAGESVYDDYAQWLSVLASLTQVDSSLWDQANISGLSATASQSWADVADVSDATQLAGRLVPAFAFTLLPGSPAATASAREGFLTIWGNYQTASALVSTRTAPKLRAAWSAATSAPGARKLDLIILSAVPERKAFDLSAVGTLVALTDGRQTQFDAVVTSSFDQATHAAEHQRSTADRRLALIVILDTALLLLTVTLALLVRLWVSRSLSKLADQAHLVSEGELPDVEIGGPREVRTVARALNDAVVTLRGIEAQASAVAEGALTSEALTTVLPGALGQVIQASVARIVDAIHDREQAQLELAHQAAHDPLTDLPNRGHAVTLISRSLHRAQRSGTMTGLMFIDLDHFKSVNDTFGHAAGDLVLQAVSSRMTEAVRHGDMVARLGGDEFVVLLEDVTSESDFVHLAERIVVTLSEAIHVDGRELKVGASVGVAICRDGHVDGSRLMREADAAAYRAKAGGRGRVGIFDDALRRELSDHAEMEVAISEALERDEFVVYYQPVVDLTTGAAVGLEALIRWERPGVGLVLPGDFIPVAESSTLINDIGRFVLAEATRQLAEWTENDPATAHLTMAVNISGSHLSSSQLLTDVTDVLERSGLAPHRLIIEVTEANLVDDVRTTANMRALRAIGVRTALDDFGTGFTSIGQLPKLPIDTLKIDRSFVSSAEPAHQELCKLMVSAASAFGLSVVAEGVETEDQADLLRRIHVQNCQGFHFASPQPAESLDPAALVRGQIAPDGMLGQRGAGVV